MAEVILYDIAGSLLKNLGSRVLDEIASAGGFKTHLDYLKNTVNTIKNVLLDAEERQEEGQVQSHAVRGWLNRLKAPLYAADDLFDEFATRASQREAMGKLHTFFSGSNQIAFAFNFSRKIKTIRKELDNIVKDGSQFSFVIRPLEEGRFHKQVRGQTHSFVDVKDVIGREDDKEAIIDTLMSPCAAQEQPLSVVPIVGIGGLGKTTLAQFVYNDERIEKHFELKLWVCVSEVFDLTEIIKKIIMSATNSECKNVEIDQLQAQLRQEIGGKKYLLVLDDVWNENPLKWLNLRTILKVGGEGSMIVVTTRSRKVADIMGALPARNLEGLSEKKSWSLFEKMAFEPGEAQQNPRLVKLGEKIVRKCGGVPLALKTLGALLHGNEERKWILIADTNFAELHDTKINIMAILKLSYTHLLSPLKNCFAYCALFPKDYVFKKEILVDLWMAEGFVVPPNRNHCLKALGDEYLIVLLQRCFFQDVTRDEFGEISSFKMHDLMHDLALEVSGTDSKMSKFQDTDFGDTILHLSFDYHLGMSWEIPRDMLKAKQLRTFLLAEEFRDGSELNRKVLQKLISNFKCLRVLDMSDLGIRTLPKSIGKLIHLRYLNLSKNLIEELPDSITKLINMQTLILQFCYLRTLPIDTRKLTNLRTLDIRDYRSFSHMPPGLGELTSLHKLPYFVVGSRTSPNFLRDPATAQLRDLKTLNNLSGFLEISLHEELENIVSGAEEAELNAKHGLTDLLINMKDSSYRGGSNYDEVVLEGLKPPQNLKKFQIKFYGGQKFPSWAMGDSLCMTLPNLVEICLANFTKCRQVPCFSQLPFLKRLTLRFLTKVEYMEKSVHEVESPPSPSTRTFFPSLQELVLEHMYNLKGWWEETNVELSNDEGTTSDTSTQCRPLSPSSSSFSTRTFFLSLQELVLEHMYNLKGWWEETNVELSNDEGTTSDTSTQCRPLSPSFSGLIKLHIRSCPCLVAFPLSPNVEELKLEKVNKELTVLKKVTSYGGKANVGSLEHTSKLKRLNIDMLEILGSLPEECLAQLTSLEIQDHLLENTSQLEQVFKHLSSLTSLKFSRCNRLTSITVGMEHLVSLETLILRRCGELDISEKDGMPWKALTSLQMVDLKYLEKLKHLPSGLQHLTNLRYLVLSDNFNLKEVPEWIGCFSSLQSLKIKECRGLRCLPEEVRKLTSLNELSIIHCGDGLRERCRGPNGADWPYICHIPFLRIS